MRATAIVKVFYPEREANLRPILDTIHAVSEIEHVMVWINGAAYTPRAVYRGEEVFTSTGNHMMGHYAAALLAPTELIYYQDDDLIVAPESIKALLDNANDRIVYMCGIIGRKFDREAADPYAAGSGVAEGPADMVLGRAWAAHKFALVDGIQRSLSNNIDPGRAEDMYFSYKTAYVVAGCTWTDIPENGVGLCHEPQHQEERGEWARYLLGKAGIPEVHR